MGTDPASLLSVLSATAGHLINAKIDLQTGSTKASAIETLEGIIRMVQLAIAKAKQDTAS